MGEHRRQLIEKYEDSKLTLLLDEYAEVYGRISTELYEEDLASGRCSAVSDEEMDAQLDLILQRIEAEEKGKKRLGSRHRLLSSKALTAAASVFLFCVLMITVQSAGIDVFGQLARWTDDCVYYERVSRDANNPESEDPLVEKLRNTLLAQGLSQNESPTWLPEGMSFQARTSYRNSMAERLKVNFSNDTKNEWMIIEIVSSNKSVDFLEKDDQSIELFEVNGNAFYIFFNQNHWTAFWSNGTVNISIYGTMEMEELKDIIKAIGE